MFLDDCLQTCIFVSDLICPQKTSQFLGESVVYDSTITSLVVEILPLLPVSCMKPHDTSFLNYCSCKYKELELAEHIWRRALTVYTITWQCSQNQNVICGAYLMSDSVSLVNSRISAAVPTKMRSSCESSFRVRTPSLGISHFPTISSTNKAWCRAKIQSLGHTDDKSFS